MKLSFEDAIKELEELLAKLSAGNVSLDEMMKLYERGTVLTKHCQSLLDSYEKRLEVVEESDGEKK